LVKWLGSKNDSDKRFHAAHHFVIATSSLLIFLLFFFSIMSLLSPSPLKNKLFSEVQACLVLAIPLAGAQLAQAATAFVDTVMMGILGSQTIAAGALGALMFHVLMVIGSGILAAVSPLAAEAHGAGKVERVGQVVRQGWWLAAMLAIPLSLVLWHGSTILQLTGQAPENAALAGTYLRAIVWGYFPVLGFAVLRNFVSALSRPRPIIVVMIGGTLFNIAANYSLIFGKFGLPALGLAGIGWASTLSLWGMFLALGFYSVLQRSIRPYQIFSHLEQFDRHLFNELLNIGLPIGVLAAVETGLFAVITLLMGQLGTTMLAAHQIALQTASMTFTVPLGISFATTVRVGQCIGQKNFKGARLAGFVGIGISAFFMFCMGIVFWLFPTQIVSLYIDVLDPDNATVVHFAKALLGVAAMFQIVDGIQISAAGALRGIKDTRIPMLIGVVTYWGLGLTSGYWLGLRLGFGGVGLWWGLAIGLLVAACVLTWRFGTTQQWERLQNGWR
jgi:MATE family multidrug resistance protein